jgi:hypothetical protein
MRPALSALVIRLSGQFTARLSSLAVRYVFISNPVEPVKFERRAVRSECRQCPSLHACERGVLPL